MAVNYLLSAIAALIILTVHEYAHGFVAYKLGDDTAKNMGRLSLNPIRHLDPVGALCMVLFHFGWAKPVPINPRNFKHPKRDFALTALAGPLSNLIMSFFGGCFFLLFYEGLTKMQDPPAVSYYFSLFLYIFHLSNLGIALFNLIPVPPLDGSRVLGAILPDRTYFSIMRYERIIYFVFIGWLLLGSAVSRYLLSIPAVSENPVLSVLVSILSISDLLSDAIEWLSGKILTFWELILFRRIA